MRKAAHGEMFVQFGFLSGCILKFNDVSVIVWIGITAKIIRQHLLVGMVVEGGVVPLLRIVKIEFF